MERGSAEETPPTEPGRPGRQRAPDCIRRQKRRELDARRSKCRIRIGGHLERWCRLKEQLGFALHSQLAQFLLDRYSSHGCVWSPGEPEPNVLPAEALQRLVVLSHGHGQECGFIPDVKPPGAGGAARLVWECVAGHSFSWGVPEAAGDRPPATVPRTEEQRGDSGGGSPPAAGRRRSLRRAGLAAECGAAKEEGEEEGAARLPVGDGEEPGVGSDGGDGAPHAPTETSAKDHGSALSPEEKAEQGAEPRGEEEEEEEEDEDFAEDDDLAYTDDLRDENYHPSLDSDSEPQRRQSQTKTRKKPVKEEQPPNEPSLTSSSPSEEKSGRVRKRPSAKRAPKNSPSTGRTEIKHYFTSKSESLRPLACSSSSRFPKLQEANAAERRGRGPDQPQENQEGGEARDPPVRLRRLRQDLLQPPVPQPPQEVPARPPENLHLLGAQLRQVLQLQKTPQGARETAQRQAGLHLRVLRPFLSYQQQLDHPQAHPHRGEAPAV